MDVLFFYHFQAINCTLNLPIYTYVFVYVSAIRRVIARYSSVPLPSVPSNKEKARYGPIHLQRKGFLFDMFDFTNSTNVFESETPKSMEYMGQVCDCC